MQTPSEPAAKQVVDCCSRGDDGVDESCCSHTSMIMKDSAMLSLQ